MEEAQYLRAARLGLGCCSRPRLLCILRIFHRSVRADVTLETGRSETSELRRVRELLCSFHTHLRRRFTCRGTFTYSLCISLYRATPSPSPLGDELPSSIRVALNSSLPRLARQLRTHTEAPVLTRATSCRVVQITVHHLPTKRPRLSSSSNHRATLFPLSLPALSRRNRQRNHISHGRRD